MAAASPSSAECSIREAYDSLRYPGKFYPQSSPERLAMLATLVGLDPPPVHTCRILELGCGEASNLLPVAYALPGSKFLGIDLSPASIERGQAAVARLGLNNVELRVQNFMDFPRDAGEFDYIIAHGVYSWVPEEVRAQILEICARHLARHGVAYISYSTLPGGHFRQYVRDLMRFHTRHISRPSTKTQQARSIVDLVIEAVPQPTLAREVLRKEISAYKGSDSVLFHDLLAEVNDPIYFLDFMDQAMSRGLQFVSESELQPMPTAEMPEPLRNALDDIGERLLREQYLDFIHCRHFRQTLLCRSGRDLGMKVTFDRMERFLISSPVRPSTPVLDPYASQPVEFRSPGGALVTCSGALPVAAYLELGASYPRPIAYADLRWRVAQRLGVGPTLDPAAENKLVRLLISSLANRIVDFHVCELDFCAAVSERPVASPIAVAQAEQSGPVPSLTLFSIALEDPIARALLPLLDGSRDFDALLRDIATRMNPIAVTPDVLRQALQSLARAALLIA